MKSPIITKKQFVEMINGFELIYRKEEKISDFLYKELECSIMVTPSNNYQELFLDLMKLIMNDDGDWISYYIYDLDFGSNYRDGTIIDKDNKDIKLRTASDLYDLLLSEYK